MWTSYFYSTTLYASLFHSEQGYIQFQILEYSILNIGQGLHAWNENRCNMKMRRTILYKVWNMQEKETNDNFEKTR